MEKFVRTVNEMEETILVPSRLLDLAVGDVNDKVSMKGKRGSTIKDTMANTDLYHLYNIVNKVKVDLLWSQESQEELKEAANALSSSSSSSTNEILTTGHVRRPSTTSMQSIHSAASLISSSSDSDSDTGIENDSGMENEESADRRANLAADNFRRHLRGLHNSIHQMTEAATYLTLRYQNDVGGAV